MRTRAALFYGLGNKTPGDLVVKMTEDEKCD